MSKKTLVVGASTNSSRYSYLAIKSLRSHGYPAVGLGLRTGKVADVEIVKEKIVYSDIHTVTLYVAPRNQPVYYDYIEQLNPKRVIFNPGTENPVFENRLKKAGIDVEIACTLVLISTRQY